MITSSEYGETYACLVARTVEPLGILDGEGHPEAERQVDNHAGAYHPSRSREADPEWTRGSAQAGRAVR